MADGVAPKSIWLIALLASVVAIWGASGYFLYPESDRGTFGDMFGAVNALFSGLAFAALIYTVLLQRYELSLQRKELELTRAELQGQKQQMQAQAETLGAQRLENTFFQLLRVHNDIINAIDLVDPQSKDVTKSRDCFRVFFKRYRNIFDPYVNEHPNEDALTQINSAYRLFYDRHQGEIGHYFRNLYHIIKFVKTSGIEEKKMYTNFVRAQLSSFELALLFYNCLSVMGRDKFKPLVEEFALLKTLPDNLIINLTTHKPLYASSAFGT